VSSPTSITLLDVGGYVEDRFNERVHAYAVGYAGVVLRRESGEWEAMESGVDVALFALGCGPDGALYAGGAGGVMIRLEKGAWKPFETPTEDTLRGFSVAPTGELFVVGGTGDFSGVALRLEAE
jgi:hypothetical protein